MRGMPGGEPLDLLTELRTRGFARGDTERMRLVLEALPHLVAPSRRTRRLIHRPYFDEARAVFEIVAPTCGGNPEMLASFLSDPEAWLEDRAGANRHAEPPRASLTGGGGRRRRRGRRGGRSRHRRRDEAATRALGAAHNGEASSLGEREQSADARHGEAADSVSVQWPPEELAGRPLDPPSRSRG
jgi:hypothetical protein